MNDEQRDLDALRAHKRTRQVIGVCVIGVIFMGYSLFARALGSDSLGVALFLIFLLMGACSASWEAIVGPITKRIERAEAAEARRGANTARGATPDAAKSDGSRRE